MNKILKAGLILTVAIAMILIGTGTAFAASGQTATEVKGVVTAVATNITPNTVTITLKDASVVVLKVDSSTVITKTGAGIVKITDLVINDKVTAIYDQNTNIATKISDVQPLGKRHSFEGTIKSLPTNTTGTTVVVTTKKGDETFNVSSATKYRVPGVKNAALADFSVGDKVSVSTAQVTISGATVQIAQSINLIPAKPIKTVRTGTVTAYMAGATITIQDKKGASSTFIINADTKISYNKGVTGITVGDRVTISASRIPSESQFTAKVIRDFGVKQTKPDNNADQNGNGNGKGNGNNK